MNVPKLRFKEFTDEWQYIKLQKLISIYKEQSTIENQYPMLTSSKQGLILQKDYYSNDARITNRSNIGYNILPYGYITYRNRSDTGFFTFNINLKLKKALVSYFYPVFSLKNSNEYFLVNLLNTKYQFKIYAISEGTSQKVLSITHLKILKILCPSLKEQQKITNFLSTIDKKIENLNAIIENLEQQKKGLMQQIFSQKLRFKDENGNDYPDWKKKKLGDIGNFSKGGNLSKSDLSQEGFPCILYGELYTHYNEFATEIKSKTLNTANLVLSKKYDVLLPLSGETAEDISTCTCIFFDDIALGSDLLIFRSSFFDGRFMSLLLKYKYKYKIAQIAQGKSIVHISAKNIKNINVKIPCLEEQQKIADFILIFTKKLDNQKAQLEHWQQIKKGLLQQMFV